MLVIRLSRVGRKNDPSFRVVLQEKHRAPSGKAIEYLGSYNAKLKQKSFKAERIKYWISEGAQLSDTVHNLLVDEKIIASSKRKASTTKVKKKDSQESQEQASATDAGKTPKETPAIDKTEAAEEEKPAEEIPLTSSGQTSEEIPATEIKDKKTEAASAEKKVETPAVEVKEEPKKEKVPAEKKA